MRLGLLGAGHWMYLIGLNLDAPRRERDVGGRRHRAAPLTHKAFCARHASSRPSIPWKGGSPQSIRRCREDDSHGAALSDRPFAGFRARTELRRLFARGFESKPNPAARVSLTVYDGDGKLRA